MLKELGIRFLIVLGLVIKNSRIAYRSCRLKAVVEKKWTTFRNPFLVGWSFLRIDVPIVITP